MLLRAASTQPSCRAAIAADAWEVVIPDLIYAPVNKRIACASKAG